MFGWIQGCTQRASSQTGREHILFVQNTFYGTTRMRHKDARNVLQVSSIDMYNNDVGKESAQKFMKQTGALKAATLYFAS